MDNNTRVQTAPKNRDLLKATIGCVLIGILLILSNIWQGNSARRSTEEAVHSVSNFYLQELAGRREQVVASNLNDSINKMYAAVGLLRKEDLSSIIRLQVFSARMRTLYKLEKFAFVDANGLIYTEKGAQDGIESYSFDYRVISGPEISVKDLDSTDKKVIIAIPVNDIPFVGQRLVACFMEIDINRLLEGISLQTDSNSATFCNLYYEDGTSLTNIVLGGQSADGNLLTALREAEFPTGYSLDRVEADFREGNEGIISFTYHGTSENMYYTPVTDTNWMLTYLIRESIIGEQINTISQGIILRSTLQTVGIAIVMFAVFAVIILQNRRAGRLALEKETAEAENRAKQQELEQRLALQNQLLEQERQNESLTIMHGMLKSGPWFMDFDEQGQMTGVTWSDTFREMLGYSGAEDFPDRLESWSDLLHKDDKERVLNEFNETINDYTGQKVYDVEYRLLTKNAGWRWFHAVGQLSRRPDGTPITYVGIFVDITESKQMEQALAE